MAERKTKTRTTGSTKSARTKSQRSGAKMTRRGSEQTTKRSSARDRAVRKDTASGPKDETSERWDGTSHPSSVRAEGTPNARQRARDVRKAAAEGKKGRTSDPASRDESKRASSVPPDLSEGVKQSDGGEERYPFPPQGDVDIALIGDKKYKGEADPPFNHETWVVLGEHESVPDHAVGQVAAMVDPEPDNDDCYRVKLRGTSNEILSVPREAFARVSLNGRQELIPFA